MDLLSDLRDRRILRFVVAYAAAAWVALQLADQLVANEVLPRVVYAAVLTLAICAAPGALVVAWFHGAKGRQDVPREEVWILSVVGVVALVATGLVVRAGVADGDPARGIIPMDGAEDPRNVAVLYFEPRGGGDAEFLAPGLTEALIDELGAVSGLSVISRSGAQAFRNGSVGPDSIGRALRSGTLVTGTVAQAGDRIRVDVSAVHSLTGVQFASTRLERPRDEIFQLQDELADSVATFVRRQVGMAFGERRLRAGTRSVEAWELVQRGDQRAHEAVALRGGGAGWREAVEDADGLFERAEAADPGWLEPVLRRGWLAYRQSRLGGMDQVENERWIERGLGHARRALEADGDHPEALELHATLEYWRLLLGLVPPSDVPEVRSGVETRLARAVANDPNRASAHTTLSHLYLATGRYPQAKLSAQQGYERDPFLESANLTLWRLFLASWNLGEAIESRRACQEGERRFGGDYRFVQCRLMLLALPGADPHFAEAWQWVDRFADGGPPQLQGVNRNRGRLYVAMGLARAGLADSARSVATSSRSDSFEDPLRETALMESIVLSWVGEVAAAVERLGVYLAANPSELESYRARGAQGDLPWYHASLLGEPQFRALVGLR
jgi:TolB-like protein/tetratricopeptide (TPR) repeat protein